MSEDKNLVRELCDLEIPSNIKVSPTGHKVLYSTQLTWGHRKGKHAVSTLWLASTGQPNSSEQLTNGSSNDHSPAWHPNGESIAFISDRAKPGEQWAIYLMQIEKRLEDCKADPITSEENERTIDAFAFSPDGKSVAFISADEKTTEQKSCEENGEDVEVWGADCAPARLRIVDLQTKQIRSLTLARHVLGFGWSPNGKQLGIASCKRAILEEPFVTGTTISVVDAGLSIVEDICHFPKWAADLTWANDGKLYFRAGVPADKLFCGQGVYAADRELLPLGYEKVAFGVESDVCELTQKNGEVIAKLEHRLESRVSLISGKVLYSKKEELEAFDVAFRSGSDEILLAVATSNTNHPVEVFTTTVGDDTMIQLSNHGHKFKDRNFGTCTFLSCLSTDEKEEIDSLYLTPSLYGGKEDHTTPVEPLPTIVLIHGGPNTRITNAFNTLYFMFTPYLLSLGYGVLLPNYRSSRGRGENFAAYSIGGQGVCDYADIIGTTQHAIERGYADKNRIIVGGWSQGGFLTNLCCVRNGLHGYGWEFKAGISGAGICDDDTMALTSDFGYAYKPELHEDRVIWNMDSNDIRNRRSSALWEFRGAMEHSKRTGDMVVPPMLILHGANDPRCHVSNAWGMRRALEAYDLPFEMAIYPRQGHMFQEQNFWIDMALRVGRWCNKYIGHE